MNISLKDILCGTVNCICLECGHEHYTCNAYGRIKYVHGILFVKPEDLNIDGRTVLKRIVNKLCSLF